MNEPKKHNMPADWQKQLTQLIADAKKIVAKAKKLKKDRLAIIIELRSIYHAKRTRAQKQELIPYLVYGWERSNTTLRSIEPEWKTIVAREQRLLERQKRLSETHQLSEDERMLLDSMGGYAAEVYAYIEKIKVQKLPQTDKK